MVFGRSDTSELSWGKEPELSLRFKVTGTCLGPKWPVKLAPGRDGEINVRLTLRVHRTGSKRLALRL